MTEHKAKTKLICSFACSKKPTTMTKKYTGQLSLDGIFHIFNRGVNGEDIFKEEPNYSFFLKKLAHYVHPVAQVYAYALLKNHFHLLIRIRSFEEIALLYNEYSRIRNIEQEEITEMQCIRFVTLQFSHFFNSYAQAINKSFVRTGPLFEHPFRRVKVEDETQMTNLIYYIHTNPMKHKFTDDFRSYANSSYQSYLTEQSSLLQRQEVLEWFGGKDAFRFYHESDQAFCADDF
jgi:putative transposase